MPPPKSDQGSSRQDDITASEIVLNLDAAADPNNNNSAAQGEDSSEVKRITHNSIKTEVVNDLGETSSDVAVEPLPKFVTLDILNGLEYESYKKRAPRFTPYDDSGRSNNNEYAELKHSTSRSSISKLV